jgi:hypothetical protein
VDDAVVRRQVVELLRDEHAHAGTVRAFAGLAPGLRARRPPGSPHSVWDLLEHLRLAQEDILRYTLDAGWRSPAWPEGYWPAPAEEVEDAAWDASLARLRAELDEVCRLVEDPARDLTAAIPHGEGRTYLRQALLVADHNAYHVGQVVQIRKALGAW